ncbi:MAG: hypothetical protein AB1Z81_13285 [Desulfotignum sp.]
MENNQKSNRKKPAMFKDGTLFFTKETERRIFFIMTLIMLASGAVVKFL